ncbi:MAG: hypothetical protein A3I09_00555 [Deltaproteobacteria bacterium RIFCSPLOWO2_02_FULL_47_10]|nr:MAG: hypothetical protein A3I09_00555 [Deltaproteobacteria bacterium RIFCSPLOWO2_02_FULL_47_10]
MKRYRCIFYSLLLLLLASCDAGTSGVTDVSKQTTGTITVITGNFMSLTSKNYKLDITFPAAIQTTELVGSKYTLKVQ